MQRNPMIIMMDAGRVFCEASQGRVLNRMNKLKKYREDRLMSKAELARRAGLSALTIDRIEKGHACRIDTQRRILTALDLAVEDKSLLFDDTPDPPPNEER